MKFFIYNFLCVPSLTVEFGVACLTVVFTILTLSIFGVNASELSSMFSDKIVVFVTILLLLLTWLIAVIGASMRSRKLITFTIILWTIFIIMWLGLSLFFRVIKKNTQFCLAKKCAPSMWLGGKGGGEDGGDGEDKGDDDGGDDRRRLRWKNDSPEITDKTFHPTKANVMPTSYAATLDADTVVSNQRSMMIGVNNGCGHQRITTENPPSDLITRVMEYRKNMSLYRQFAEAAIQRHKKKGRKKGLDDDDEKEKDSDDGDSDTEASSPPIIDLLLLAVFLRKIPQLFSANHFQSSNCRLQ
ncbi:uncharacterized protein LOC111035808 [Myzus persicae]|uniref:uncharacterized protein LOC111035808 n=1 Tax=Myzus persicae TaxID=13164 RepID=UPI000B93A0E8|nr:uncharacterized protein LOC111035808 [Myzus persicae]